jgi:hypothetical protein
MVVGLDRWQAHFAGFEDRYVLVGGVACERLMDEAGLGFRLTKDLDVVLIVELLDAGFVERFWAFIEAGGYERRAKADGGKLYRFEKPGKPDFPFMIELFSRIPEGVSLAGNGQLTPLPIDEEVASLSAILLDADYYDYLKSNMANVAGLPVLSEVALIPFKARAFLDLSERRANGEKVDSRDIKKHRADVFRLAQLLAGNAAFELPTAIRHDMQAFLESVRTDGAFDPKAIGLELPLDEASDRLARAYGLGQTDAV